MCRNLFLLVENYLPQYIDFKIIILLLNVPAMCDYMRRLRASPYLRVLPHSAQRQLTFNSWKKILLNVLFKNYLSRWEYLALMVNEWILRSTGGMIARSRIEVWWEKPVPVPLGQTKIPHWLACLGRVFTLKNSVAFKCN